MRKDLGHGQSEVIVVNDDSGLLLYYEETCAVADRIFLLDWSLYMSVDIPRQR